MGSAKIRMNRRCPRCGRIGAYCQCEDICDHCLWPKPKCVCEEQLRPAREFAPDDARFDMDEDVADELRRQYGERNEERSDRYWHGYNKTRVMGKKRQIKCPYRAKQERDEFYRGVSDARSTL